MQRHWRPSATIETLRLRAAIINQIREFFTSRGLLEVETPLLCHASVTATYLHSFLTDYLLDDHSHKTTLYLQTSPEYAMKRLLAAGSGPIFQICKAFRNNGESGRMHNPEFTLLEWYRPEFDHHDLMDEMDDLLQLILTTEPAERLSYAELFNKYLNLDPHDSSPLDLKTKAYEVELHIDPSFNSDNKDDWLSLLMTHIIEPNLGQTKPTFVYDYPVTQAALAKIRTGEPPVAERFEVYFKGIELANGFHELTNANEQKQRFETDAAMRKHWNYPTIPMDENLLAALEHGMPACAGVALGIDRLIMLALEKQTINEVISFNTAIA